jgi:ABC-2 type transport system ATP-binding protein
VREDIGARVERRLNPRVEPDWNRAPMTGRRTAPSVASMFLPTTTTTAQAVQVRGLRMRYGDLEAVRGIDLDVRRGDILALLGPNGAGKTTTVEILEGFRAPSAGEVSVLDADPRTAPRAWRDRIGIVLQESSPEINLSVRECLQLYAGYYSAPRGVDDTIALAGLDEQADQEATKLSGGQRRRLDVALALIGDPELIFLDEPTTGFDPAARRQAWEVIGGLRALGKTILLTTHYMEEAERLADRIVVMARGEIVADGTPATLGGRDRAAAIVSFTLPPGAGEPPMGAAVDERGRVALRTERPMAELHELTCWALDRELELTDLEVRRPTLEDVYLELT